VPPPLVCRPLHFAESLSRRLHLFVALLHPTCSVGCRVARWPPSTSQSAPLPLFTPLHSLVVVWHHIFWLLGLPLPLSSHLRLLLRPSCSVGCRIVLHGTPASFPPYCRAQNATAVVINIIAIGSSSNIITIVVTWGIGGGSEASSLQDILLLEGSVAGNNDFEVIICTCVDSC
jgi:hypothetical protein